jgi:hypothetical protein
MYTEKSEARPAALGSVLNARRRMGSMRQEYIFGSRLMSELIALFEDVHGEYNLGGQCECLSGQAA